MYMDSLAKQPTNLRNQTKKKRNITTSQYLCISIAILLISSLIMVIIFSILNGIRTQNSKTPKDWFEGSCPTIIKRSVWNATEPKKNYIMLSTPVPYVATLHTATTRCKSQNSCISIIKEVQRYHMITQKWDDIGFNFLVGDDGHIYEGRGWKHVGAHCKGYNSKAIGIGIIGDYTSTPLSQSLITAVKSLINCGISSGVIQKNYTYLKHQDYGIREDYILNLTKSNHSIYYCLSKTTTASPK